MAWSDITSWVGVKAAGLKVLASDFNLLNDNAKKVYDNTVYLKDQVVLLSSLGGFAFAGFLARIIKSGSNAIVPAFSIQLTNMTVILESDATLTTADLDTGSAFAFGADHYIWAGEPASGTIPVLKISLSATSPAGMTNPKIIGGFHFGKIRNSFTATDVANGILPNSAWDLAHMPKCYLLGLSDPATYQLGGMVEVIPGSLWVDIYLASDGGGTLPNKRVYSKINVVPITGTEGLNWYDFAVRGRVVGKRMLTYAEWTAAALGSPQGIDASNLNGWTKTTNTGRVKTGATVSGDSDTNYILGYNTSLLNVRDCVGNVWEWLADLSNRHDSTAWAYQNVLDAGELAASSDFGQAYLPNNVGMVAYIAGGYWADGVLAGARAVHVGAYPWYVNTSVGCRFACDSL
jgi:hypothetical protein